MFPQSPLGALLWQRGEIGGRVGAKPILTTRSNVPGVVPSVGGRNRECWVRGQAVCGGRDTTETPES